MRGASPCMAASLKLSKTRYGRQNMLSTVKSIESDARPPTKSGTVTREMAMTALTSVLSYMRDAGAIVAQKSNGGELFLRIRFADARIVPVNEDSENVYYDIVPIMAQDTTTERKP